MQKGVKEVPYGFIKHIESKGYSKETVLSYRKVLNLFIIHLNSIYPEGKEPYEINPSDIKNYLSNQLQDGKMISTLNKELGILKTWFNYLWERDIVKVDPAVKIKRLKTTDSLKIDITYEDIQLLLPKVLSNPSYQPIRKVIFLLATKGLKTSDFRFTKDDILISEKNNEIEIPLSNRKLILKDQEADHFLEYYNSTLFNGSDFVFITNKSKEGPVAIEVMSILTHLRAISNDYLPNFDIQLTLVNMRRALIYYLYTKKKLSIQQIAAELGIEEQSAANYLNKLAK